MDEEILEGLKRRDKCISSKYLYDEIGSKIFQEIMSMPEYYLFDAEHEILSSQSENIHRHLPFDNHYSVVELGAGDGSKTIELLKVLEQDPLFNRYIPVDISSEATVQIQDTLSSTLPDLKVSPIIGNYHNALAQFIPQNEAVLVLNLGSNIGNFNKPTIENLVQSFGRDLRLGDAMLVGMDLRKNPNVIAAAYNDSQGITKRFNFNLLTRLNRDLGGNFNLSTFDFYSFYNPDTGEVRSYLISLIDQDVKFTKTGDIIHFNQFEYIHTEISKKFNYDEIQQLSKIGGFSEVYNFIDKGNRFTDSLWIK
ncbi:L-histidine N(alpha)-methyltransferase [Membranihabitans marinus]